MKLKRLKTMIILGGVGLSQCLSGCIPPPLIPAPKEAPSDESVSRGSNNYYTNQEKQSLKNFMYWFADSHGIYRQETALDSTRKIFDNGNIIWPKVKPSPDKSHVAFVYMENDRRILAVLNLKSGKVNIIESIPYKFNFFSFEWRQDSKVLAVGYYEEASFYSNNGNYKGEIFTVSPDGTSRKSLGCAVSRIVIGWLTVNSLLVQGPKKTYGVDVLNCSTLFSMESWRYLSLSPDGTKISYLKYVEAFDTQLGETRNMRELHLADSNGDNDTVLINFHREPEIPHWSPSGDMITCAITSPNYEDEKYVAICDLKTRETIYMEEPNSGIWDLKWSPNGAYITYNRQNTYYNRYNMPLRTERSIIALEIKSGNRTILKTIQSKSPSSRIQWDGGAVGEVWDWVDPETLAVLLKGKNEIVIGLWVYSLNGQVITSFPLSKPILLIESEN